MEEAPPSVTLVPPRFRRKGSTQEELEVRARSPFDEALGARARTRALQAHSAEPGLTLSSALGVDDSFAAFAHAALDSFGSPSAGGGITGREGPFILSGFASDSLGQIRAAASSGSATAFALFHASGSSGINYGVSHVGARYGSRHLGVGAALSAHQLSRPLELCTHPPPLAWAVARNGPLVAGFEYGARYGPRVGIGIRRSDSSRGTAVDASATASPISGDWCAGYVFQQALRRKVRNVFEDERVRAITSYVDVALELSGGPGKSPEWTLGVSGQLNKNLLGKVSLGPLHGFRTSLGLKVWTDPSIEVSVTSQVPLRQAAAATPDMGFSIHVENIGQAVYTRASSSGAQREKNKLMRATEGELVDLDSRVNAAEDYSQQSTSSFGRYESEIL